MRNLQGKLIILADTIPTSRRSSFYTFNYYRTKDGSWTAQITTKKVGWQRGMPEAWWELLLLLRTAEPGLQSYRFELTIISGATGARYVNVKNSFVSLMFIFPEKFKQTWLIIKLRLFVESQNRCYIILKFFSRATERTMSFGKLFISSYITTKANRRGPRHGLTVLYPRIFGFLTNIHQS